MARYNQRKPWPQAAAHIYFELRHLSRQMTENLLDLQGNGLNGIRDPYRVRRLIPTIRTQAIRVQNACLAYESGKKGRNKARWAGWAIAEIDIYGGAILIAMNRAEQAITATPKNPHLLRRMVKDALDLAPRIEQQLNAGPPPTPPQADTMDEINEIAGKAWGKGDNHER